MSNVIKVPGVSMQNTQHQQQPPHTLLSMETALLIATASGREVDVNVWFKTSINNGLMPAREFDSKLRGLATAMGIDQEEDVKRELELAVSQIALRMVHVICGAGNDKDGQPLVDLNYFFKLCQEKVDKYLLEINESEGGAWEDDKLASDHNFRNWVEGEYDIKTGRPIVPSTDLPLEIQSIGDDSNAIRLSAEQYIEDSKQKAEGERPKTAPSGKRAASRSETTEEVLLNTQAQAAAGISPRMRHLSLSPAHDQNIIVETKLTPASPYDEAVEFRDYYDEHHLDVHIAAPVPPNQQGKNYWDEQNRKFLTGSNVSSPTPVPLAPVMSPPLPPTQQTDTNRLSSVAKPRPSSAPRTGTRSERYLEQLKHLQVGPLRNRGSAADESRDRSSSRGRRLNSVGANGAQRSRSETRASRGGSLLASSNMPLTPGQMLLLKKEVEAMVCETVRQADLYHLIQVNFGFIDNYTMIPPRGAIVKSERKAWLSKRDLQVAFLAARLALNEPQLLALRCLVDDFAQQYPSLYTDKADAIIALPGEAAGTTTPATDPQQGNIPLSALGKNDQVHSEWMKRYLVHLRLTKRLSLSSANLAYALRQSTASGTGAEALLQQENQPPSNIEAGVAAGVSHSKDAPMLWTEWLGKKLQREMNRTPLPQELQRALQGENHHLSKNTVDALLMPKSGISILSEAEIAQELELRVESWVLDTDGRRDFQHALNVNIRKWIRENLVINNNNPQQPHHTPVDEAAYWRLWEQLPEAERLAQRDVLLQKTVNEYRDKLETSETVHRQITKALYWEYDKYVRENVGRKESFAYWLTNVHFKKFRDRLDHFKAEEEVRQAKIARLHKRRKSIAPLSVLLANLEEVKLKTGIPLNAQQRREELKAIVALRKLARTNQTLYMQLYHKPSSQSQKAANSKATAAEEGGEDEEMYLKDADFVAQDSSQHHPNTAAVAGAGAVAEEEVQIVTKEEFDAHVRSVFAPYLPQNDTILEEEVQQQQNSKGKPPVSIASNKVTAQKLALFRKTWQEKINAVFSGDISGTVKQAMDEHLRKRREQGKHFGKWLVEKRQLQLQQGQLRAQEKAQVEESKESKRKQGEKAYKKWLRLRRQHKYKSMVDKKAHFVPEARAVQHQERWLSLDIHSQQHGEVLSQSQTLSSRSQPPPRVVREEFQDDLSDSEPPRHRNQNQHSLQAPSAVTTAGRSGNNHRYSASAAMAANAHLLHDERPLPTSAGSSAAAVATATGIKSSPTRTSNKNKQNKKTVRINTSSASAAARKQSSKANVTTNANRRVNTATAVTSKSSPTKTGMTRRVSSPSAPAASSSRPHPNQPVQSSKRFK